MVIISADLKKIVVEAAAVISAVVDGRQINDIIRSMKFEKRSFYDQHI